MPSQKRKRQESITIWLDPQNPEEKHALEILESGMENGHSKKQVIVAALREMDLGNVDTLSTPGVYLDPKTLMILRDAAKMILSGNIGITPQQQAHYQQVIEDVDNGFSGNYEVFEFEDE